MSVTGIIFIARGKSNVENDHKNKNRKQYNKQRGWGEESIIIDCIIRSYIKWMVKTLSNMMKQMDNQKSFYH